MAKHWQCGKSWTGQSKSHCAVCHATFSSDWSGDRHRVGEWDDGTRRCLNHDEMERLGLEMRDGVWWRKRTEAEVARIVAQSSILGAGDRA